MCAVGNRSLGRCPHAHLPIRASSILNSLNSETNIKRLLLESRRLMGDGISSFTNELNGCGLSAVRHCSSYSRLVDNEKKIIHTLEEDQSFTQDLTVSVGSLGILKLVSNICLF